MKFYFAKPVFFLLIPAIVSCSSNVESTTTQDTIQVKNDSPKHETEGVATPAPVSLKDMSIDENTMITGRKLFTSRQLNNEEVKLFSIETIDTGAPEDDCTYHIVDTLFSGNDIKILLIGRVYTEENIIWALVYDKNNNLLDNKQVYYDNSEGAMSVQSSISNNSLTIKSINDYGATDEERERTEVYSLNELNRFVKQN
jgi:hypothetical protein